MRLGPALASLPLLSVATARAPFINAGGLRRLQDDKGDGKCAADDERAEECGAGSNRPKKCCPGHECRGGDSVRCKEIKPEKGEPTMTPTKAATNAPTEAPVVPTPKPTNRPTEQPTRKSERTKPRTWHTILTDDRLRKVVEPQAISIKRYVWAERDPFKFTEEPSAAPSSMPSLRPSASPSSSPTAVPTSSPTYAPTATPTEMRKDECKLMMYYERKWCWHEDHPKNKDCKRDFEICADKKGDDMIMLDCDEGPTKWAVRGFTVRPEKDKDMCWTRRGDTGIRLDKCDPEGKGNWKAQRFEGVCEDKPHMIHPLGDKKWCLTSGHEPRNDERLKFQECDKVDNSKTHLWVEK